MQIIIAAGGTGGHIFPALAVALELIAQQHRCLWVGRPQSLEQRIAKDAGIQFYPLKMSGLRGKGLTRQLRTIVRSGWATAQVILLLQRLKKIERTVVVTFGGYTSVAPGIAARLLRLPLIIHEQNSIAGSANRILAKWARLVCCGFPQTFPHHPARVLVGNPIRSLTPLYRSDSKPIRILVLGGSLGAASLNHAIVTSLHQLAIDGTFHLVHQCGETTHARTVDSYRKLTRIQVRLRSFLHRVDWYYGWCDLVICRAGAVTLAELCAAGKTAIMVPLPHAIDDHQRHNASTLAATGGAVVLEDNPQLAQQLTQLLAQLLAQQPKKLRAELQRKGKLLASLAKPTAARDMAALVTTITGAR